MIKKGIGFHLLALMLYSCHPESQLLTTDQLINPDISDNVIYGSDSRLDLYEVTDPQALRLAQSTVALVKASDVTFSEGQAKILGRNFGSAYNLCASERFRDQDLGAFCSGSLIADDIILTAGHCVTSQEDCDSTKFVFGFGYKSQSFNPFIIPSSEVYECQSIIRREQESFGADFALIKLKKKVTNHVPLYVRKSGDPAVGDPLIVIGHPAGLPTKVTLGSVRSIQDPNFFVTNLDTYGGNSGSAVFSARSGLIEGILVRGETDFIYSGSCRISNLCSETGCRGEDVTRVKNILSFIQLPDSGGGSNPPVNPPSPSPQPNPPSPALPTESFASKNSVAIPDMNFAGINSNVIAATTPKGRIVTVTVQIKHTYIGDLVLKLKAPDGSTVLLQQRRGGAKKDLIAIFGEDTASAQSLEVLSYIKTAGAWTLQVADLGKYDTGTLLSWSLNFKAKK